ncbi:MAG: metallophosphoesterase family protein [Gemmatimonadota bacterium]
MPDILHISDLHFGPPLLPNRAAGVRHLIAATGPDLVVVSGDFTQRAKRRQFREARAFLDTIAPPVVVTPGNHDVPLYRVHERLFTPHRHYLAHISPRLDSVHRIDGLTLVCLNSSRASQITNGRLAPRQLEFAERAFAEADPSDVRVVVFHHNPIRPADTEPIAVLRGAARALAAFEDMGVRLILSGHAHRAYLAQVVRGAAGSAGRPGMVLAGCGTTTSSRGRAVERGANSLNLVRVSRTAVEITRHLWDEGAGRFRPHSEHRFGAAVTGRTVSPAPAVRRSLG